MSQLIEVKVPDIGDFNDIPVIEIAAQVGAAVGVDESLLTLESDKATMDVPSPVAGVIRELKVKLGDKVSEGSVVALIEAAEATAAVAAPAAAQAAPAAPTAPAPAPAAAPAVPVPAPAAPVSTRLVHSPLPEGAPATTANTHASPSVRLFARELGVDLRRVAATGPKGRILKEDVTAYIKNVMLGDIAAPSCPAPTGGGGSGLDLLPWPQVDFAKFGPVEVKPLPRIRRISAQNLARNWVMIPAVTYHEEADVTELEAFRQQLNGEKGGVKFTMLAFVLKACAIALKKFPEFNSSLEGDKDELRLVLKKYVHIAFAADTPQGLLVPVIRDVDQKSVSELAVECGALATKARDGKLAPSEMTGACFTISSLGGIGGVGFAPIINAPEVAILGVSKSIMKPVWNGSEFVPRLILPLSLTADHRVIDGAQGTRFTAYVAQLLADLRRALV